MFSARKAILAVATASLMASAGNGALAAEHRRFTQADFQAAQAAGRPILVDVAAWWCPICKAQEPIVDKLSASPKFVDLVIFRLDYDTQRDEWRKFGVRMQSTLIAFHGAHETDRVVGETHSDALARVLDATLK